MKTVVQIVQHMRPGGIETMVLDLERFSRVGYRTIIVSLEGQSETAIADWSRLRDYADRIYFLNKSAGWQLGVLWKLRRLLLDCQADAVHTHHIGPMIYGGVAARLAGVPITVHTEHDAWHLASPKRRWLQRLVMALTRPLMVADAKQVKKGLLQAYPGLSVNVILNGIDIHHFTPAKDKDNRESWGLQDNVKLIGTAGRLEAIKGHEVLIEAMLLLPPDVHLVIAGQGSLEDELAQQVENLELNSRIHFLGRIDDMPLFYRSLDVFCLPSWHEGMPLSVLEAQACNVCSVITDVGGAKEAICPTTGRLVTAGDVQGLANALSELLEQSTATKNRPRDFVVQSCDMQSVVNKYQKLYWGYTGEDLCYSS